MNYPVYFDFDAQVYTDVDTERAQAHAKHGANGNSRETAPANDIEWLPILVEEVGEVAHELTYDCGSEEQMSRLRAELVQVAAMACAWIEAIDRGEPMDVDDQPIATQIP